MGGADAVPNGENEVEIVIGDPALDVRPPFELSRIP